MSPGSVPDGQRRHARRGYGRESLPTWIDLSTTTDLADHLNILIEWRLVILSAALMGH